MTIKNKPKLKFLLLTFLLSAGVFVSYTNCSKQRGTETGNPMAPSYMNDFPNAGNINAATTAEKLTKAICYKVNECYQIDNNSCFEKVINQPQLTFELKVPQYATLKDIIALELSMKLNPNIENAKICMQAILDLQCNSSLISGHSQNGNYEDIQLILRAYESCQNIF